MSTEQTLPEREPTREDLQSALFADLIVRQSNMALMFLGQVPVPGAKERTVDLEAAQMFIDQLEMIESKTRGNLTREEEHFLKQSLMQLRLAFVKAAEQPATGPQAPSSTAAAPGGPAEAVASQPESPVSKGIVTPEAEHKVKFSKTY